MAIPSSGPISLDTVQTEFGGTNPIAISEYYAGGGLVGPGTSGTYGPVPSSGAISLQNFYGTSAAVAPTSVSYVNVAGGGGGASNMGGGGGAGGYLTSTVPVAVGTYPVSIGGGGSVGAPGSTSSFNGVTTTGGGTGGSQGGAGSPGGSGGGGGGINRPNAPLGGGSGIPGQGNPGNFGNQGEGQATGGNGGGRATSTPAIDTTARAGGGGGGLSFSPGQQAGQSGAGGGAGANGATGQPSTAGAVNKGGGGGGQASYPASRAGSAGGSGIVIIQYPTASYAANAYPGATYNSGAGGVHKYTFTSSGSITW